MKYNETYGGNLRGIISKLTYLRDLGIKVMIDAVFNHSGWEFFAWKDVVKNKRASKYYDWFFIQEDDFYFSFAFVDEMPKLNTNNTEVADYLCKVCKEWIEKWNIDGIRFDVGNEIQWKYTKGRLISYVRPGDVTIEVYINAGEQQVSIDLQEQETIFARGYMD